MRGGDNQNLASVRHGRSLVFIRVRGASCWFRGLRKRALDHFVGLGSADQNASLTSADEQSRNTADADLARQVLIGQDLSRVLPSTSAWRSPSGSTPTERPIPRRTSRSARSCPSSKNALNKARFIGSKRPTPRANSAASNALRLRGWMGGRRRTMPRCSAIG